MRLKDKKKKSEETTFTLNFITAQDNNEQKPIIKQQTPYVPDTPLESFPIYYLDKTEKPIVKNEKTEVVVDPDLFVSPILGVQNNTVISDRESNVPRKAYENFMNNPNQNLSKSELKRSFGLLNTEEHRDILIHGYSTIDHNQTNDGYSVEKDETVVEEFYPTHSNYEYFTEPTETNETKEVEASREVIVEPLPWEDEDLTDMMEESVEEFVEETPKVVEEIAKPQPVERPKVVQPQQPKPAYQKPTKKTKYVAPPLNLLKKNKVNSGQNKAWIEERAEAINRVFSEFNYRAKVGGYVEGPAVTLFLIDIEPGTDVSKINSYTKTLTMRLRTKSLRIQDPIPGLDCAGIEIPNENRTTVLAGNLINNPKFLQTEKRLSFALGLNLNGEETYADIEKMPHGLVAGATGSGKSVCINTLIISLIYNNTPDELRFVLIDPKMVELSIYNDIPHLAMPVITEAKKLQLL